MSLDLPATLAFLAAGCALLAFAYWRGSRPAAPLKVRMVNYNLVQIFAVVFILVMAAHVVTLIKGSAAAAVLR
jgi:hypothetical protein